ncbi:MAG: bifunctional helix-turn-helix transcriptional regulator/GNAT family N-acetyltransferase [Bacteroidales bacterium]|nr:bifunctional helix-turn-helix transcriptional regulator/GNAT family N-acetyltransferase [Bacteroidales bacterium]
MEFIRELGTLALWSRLRSFSDLLLPGVLQMYHEMGTDFEPRWFTVTQYLNQKGPSRLTDVSSSLGLSHPAVVQVINAMSEKGFVRRTQDSDDRRVSIVSLTTEGNELIKKLEPFWKDLRSAVDHLLAEHAPRFLDDMNRLEGGLKQYDLLTRIWRERVRRRLGEMRIIPFDDKYLEDFVDISRDWLQECIGISDHDEKVLANPRREVLDKGGMIYFAILDEELLGTFLLMPLGGGHCEMSKFAVKKPYRRLGIGSIMAGQAMDIAVGRGCRKILLFTHINLREALLFYAGIGFRQVKSHPLMKDPTGRDSHIMEYTLKLR